MPWKTRALLAALMLALWLVNPALAVVLVCLDQHEWGKNAFAMSAPLPLGALVLLQPVLLAMWSMLGTRSWMGNFSWAVCWLAAIWVSFQTTTQFMLEQRIDHNNFNYLGVAFAATFLFECLVFASIRWFGGRRLYHEQDPKRAKPRITLRELLLSITLLAIALGLTRTAFLSISANWLMLITSSLITGAVVSCVSLVFFLPCVWFAFEEELNLGFAAFLLFLNAMFWPGAAIALLAAIVSAPPNAYADAFPYLMLFSGTLTFSSFAALLLLRFLGFRIERVDRIATKFAVVQPVASVLPGDDNATSVATSSPLAESSSP